MVLIALRIALLFPVALLVFDFAPSEVVDRIACEDGLSTLPAVARVPGDHRFHDCTPLAADSIKARFEAVIVNA